MRENSGAGETQLFCSNCSRCSRTSSRCSLRQQQDGCKQSFPYAALFANGTICSLRDLSMKQNHAAFLKDTSTMVMIPPPPPPPPDAVLARL